MADDIQLNLEKFGSIGGDYFEHLIAVALDELGYVEGETYIASWAKKCVPGTWIEADFIISKKTDKTKDPLNSGRIVLAIGHATSENSAGMKFHRDVEQLLEVKALSNGADYCVMDILFCCPRETMGGWSKELVAINEAIFDNSLIVWKHDWGRRLLQQIQLHGEKLTQGDNTAKKKKLKELLSKHPAFRKQFEALRDHLSFMISDKKSHSKIGDIFEEERKQLPIRLAMPLLITEPEKTDFKRGLLQVLALNPWEVELLHANHQKNKNGKVVPLEQLALDTGMSLKSFNKWWERLKLLSAKIGTCSADFIGDEMLDPNSKEWRMFRVSPELAYVLERFSRESLKEVVAAVPRVAPNLVPYTIDLQDLERANSMCEILHNEKRSSFVNLCIDCYAHDPWHGIAMPRLLLFEVAKAAVKLQDRAYSYDVIANESGHPKLIQYPGFFRGIHPGKRGNPNTDEFIAGCSSLQRRVAKLDSKYFTSERGEILKRFIYERLDGMVKQPKGSVLDALMDAEIRNFSKRIAATVTSATVQGLPSAFNALIVKGMAGVNVEVPYILTLKDGRRILIHRVNANDGHAADKRKEFSSKIRSVRYEATTSSFDLRTDLAATVLVIDGKWIPESNEDPLSHIRMLTVAGWDYVVYPDQLSAAFAQIEAKLSGLPVAVKTAFPALKKIGLGSIEDLPMAAEAPKSPKLKRKGGHG